MAELCTNSWLFLLLLTALLAGLVTIGSAVIKMLENIGLFGTEQTTLKQEDTKMQADKWYLSYRVYAGLLAIIGAILGFCGVEFGQADQDAMAKHLDIIIQSGLALAAGIAALISKAREAKKTKGITGTGVISKVLSVAILCGLMASCSTMQAIHTSPRAEVVAANKMFAASVSSLADLRASGIIDAELSGKITPVIKEGKDFLFEWQTTVLEGKNQPGAWDEMQLILARLSALEAQAKAKKQNNEKEKK